MLGSGGKENEILLCYLNALRKDSGNQNILRDLSALQVQVTTNYDRLAPLIIIIHLFQLGLETS